MTRLRLSRRGVLALAGGLVLTAGTGIAACGTPAAQRTAPPSPTLALPVSAPPPGVEGELVVVRGNDLWRVPLRGGAVQLTKFRPVDLIADPVWSPNGSVVAFSHLTLKVGQKELPGADLELLDVTSRSVTTLVQSDRPGAQLTSPAWLSNAQLLFAYQATIYENDIPKSSIQEIRRLDRETGATSTVATNATTVGISPNRKAIAFLRAVGVAPELWIAGVDGTDERKLIPGGTFDAIAAPRPSPDGDRVVFAAVGGPAGADYPPSPAVRRSTDTVGDVLARITASVALAHGVPWDLWVVGSDGSGLRPLTNIREDTPTPTWSPDGAVIAFQAENGLYVVRVPDRQIVRIDDAGGLGGADWKPA